MTELTDVLDLHTFQPRDVKSLVADYVDEAVARGWTEVRIIHGKGTGTLRRVVDEVLSGHPLVSDHRPGDAHEGGSGATVALMGQS